MFAVPQKSGSGRSCSLHLDISVQQNKEANRTRRNGLLDQSAERIVGSTGETLTPANVRCQNRDCSWHCRRSKSGGKRGRSIARRDGPRWTRVIEVMFGEPIIPGSVRPHAMTVSPFLLPLFLYQLPVANRKRG